MSAKLLLLAGLLLLPSWPATAADSKTTPVKPVAHDTHDGYFVSNKFEPAEAVSFVVIRDQASFDKVFGVAMVMGDKHHRLPAGVFDKKIVVAAIHRGKSMVTYQVKNVVTEGDTLVVRYDIVGAPAGSAEFACPLILSIDKGDYHAVRFSENGKTARRLDLSPPKADAADAAKP